MQGAEDFKLDLSSGIPGGLIVCLDDEYKTIVYSNEQAHRMFDCKDKEEFLSFVNNSLGYAVSEEERKNLNNEIRIQISSGADSFRHISFHILTKKRKFKFVEAFGKIVSHESLGRICYLFLTDSGMKYRTYDIDKITGLPGRRRFLDYSAKMLGSLADIHGHPGYVFIYFNIVNFRIYNLRHGIEAGDHFLQGIAEELGKEFPNDLLARLGDDHFAVFTDNRAIQKRLDEFYERINQRFGLEPTRLTAGIYEIKKEDIPYLDAALNLAKTASTETDIEKNIFYRFYDDEIRKKAEISQYIVNNLQTAIEKRYIKVYYQPVVRTITGSLCGAEALSRWIDPTYGFLSPGLFISLLEESRTIHLLDEYVIEEVCHNLRSRVDSGEPVVPVSFNLCRLDFVLTDIFDFIVRTCEKYQIPHHMVNIEITESIVMSDIDMMQKEIQKFHEAGFAIWMDDFGSGYSSLNVLKDFTFDELKLDMKFLSSFTDKAKRIIASVVKMAKRISIQTLAEGVETQEQFHYLTAIGCEKTQGYLFSAPLPWDEMMEKMKKKDVKIEPISYNHFYDALTKIDFLSDTALMVVEYDGKDFKVLYVNQFTFNRLSGYGIADHEAIERAVNSPLVPFAKKLRSFILKPIRSGKTESLYWSSLGQYLKIDVTVVSSFESHHALKVIVHDINPDESTLELTAFDRAIRDTHMLYDTFCVLDLRNNRFFSLKPYLDLDPEKDLHGFDLAASNQAFIEKFVFKGDRIRYEEFADFSTLSKRVSDSGKGYVYDFFRLLDSDNSYVWKKVSILPLDGKKDGEYALTVAETKWSDEVFEESIRSYQERKGLLSSLDQNQRQKIFSVALTESMKEYSPLPFFFKDNDRRFIGVSQTFLDIFGFKDETEIVGRTSEEMHWHINDLPFLQTEESVLKQGKIIDGASGTCIIQGIQHAVRFCEWPVYSDGKIVGLCGCFEDLEDRNGKPRDFLVKTDAVTGLLNAIGIIDAFFQYDEEYKTHGKHYAMVLSDVTSLTEIKETYSEEVFFSALKAVGTAFREKFGKDSAIARIQGTHFMILRHFAKAEDAAHFVSSVQEALSSIHRIGDVPITLYGKCIALLDEECNFSPENFYQKGLDRLRSQE